jgi:hypothetical protein
MRHPRAIIFCPFGPSDKTDLPLAPNSASRAIAANGPVVQGIASNLASFNVPVVAISWQYDGLNPVEMEGRITSVYERVLTRRRESNVESQTLTDEA